MLHWTVPSTFKTKQHLLAAYIITYHFFHAIGNLEKFIFAKTASKKNTEKRREQIEAELSSPDGIAKRWFGDSIINFERPYWFCVRDFRFVQYTTASGKPKYA